MRFSELKQKEVINICDCKILGCVSDINIDVCTGCVLDLIVPGPGKLCGIFGREIEYIIPWKRVKQIGEDIILVEVITEEIIGKFG